MYIPNRNSLDEEPRKPKYCGVPSVIFVPKRVEIPQKYYIEALRSVVKINDEENVENPKIMLSSPQGAFNGDKIMKEVNETLFVESKDQSIDFIWKHKRQCDFSRFKDVIEHSSVEKFNNFLGYQYKI
ncbi:hypothetical protein MHBO_004471 [Bonamia ostreae]|uniref:Uncharacterized protein n=1 Tax=Bonamia ostreae TaxID=126728 RepID=A0ABV2ATE4_9EUKA